MGHVAVEDYGPLLVVQLLVTVVKHLQFTTITWYSFEQSAVIAKA